AALPDAPPVITLVSHGDLFPSRENRPDRSGFDEKSIAELAASITSKGIVQPIVIRPDPNGNGKVSRYEIVCGERRWSAAGLIGVSKPTVERLHLTKLKDLPCII